MKKRKSAVFILAFVLLYFLAGSGPAMARSSGAECSKTVYIGKVVKVPVMVVKETVVFKHRWDRKGPREVLRFGARGLRHVFNLVHQIRRWSWEAARPLGA